MTFFIISEFFYFCHKILPVAIEVVAKVVGTDWLYSDDALDFVVDRAATKMVVHLVQGWLPALATVEQVHTVKNKNKNP